MIPEKEHDEMKEALYRGDSKGIDTYHEIYSGLDGGLSPALEEQERALAEKVYWQNTKGDERRREDFNRVFLKPDVVGPSAWPIRWSIMDARTYIKNAYAQTERRGTEVGLVMLDALTGNIRNTLKIPANKVRIVAARVRGLVGKEYKRVNGRYPPNPR